jgi:dimethylhistidine N-methyltransferase
LERQRLAADLARGLEQSPKSIPSLYFYDPRGSALFQQITELDEYYLTRCEREILAEHRRSVSELLGPGPLRLVEFGAGDGVKTEILLEALAAGTEPIEYVPVDICAEILTVLADRLAKRFSPTRLIVRPVVGDHREALAELRRAGGTRNLAVFLGSSIGNMHPGEARAFFRRVRQAMQPGDCFLIGFDLKKDPEVLRRAYDDSRGVTREFNLNLLDRLNRELDAEFDRRQFLHQALYNPAAGRMESWLLSRRTQRVYVGGLDRHFALEPWEGIHVECSYKYDQREIKSLARGAGFRPLRHFHDARQYFVDSLWLAE